MFTSFDEDYGYVPLEAMLAAKGVVTCSDSGGAREFVEDGYTGLVAQSTPESLARAFDSMFEDSKAEAMGQRGLEKVRSLALSWDHVVEHLLACE